MFSYQMLSLYLIKNVTKFPFLCIFEKNKVMHKILLNITLLVSLLASAVYCNAQEVKPLFPYPEIPENVKDVNMRANFMVEHLWEVCGLEKNSISNVESFRETFTDYISFFVLSDVEVVESSVKSFVKRVSKNSENLKNVMDFVDTEVFQPQSRYYSDDIYILFAQNFMDSKKVSKEDRKNYEQNIVRLSSSKVSSVFGDLQIQKAGQKSNLHSLDSEFTILFFNVENCVDCSIYKIRMSADIATNHLIDNGIINIVSIYDTDDAEADADIAKETKNWYTAKVEGMTDKYDMRMLPCVYILGKDKKIIAKSPNIIDLLNLMAQTANAKGV